MTLLIPNLLTFGNILSGLISIILSLQWQWEFAAGFLIFATLLDKLDGFAARKLSAASPLGKNLDSLSDLISFGLAPFLFVLAQQMTTALILSGMLFVCAGTYRLAQFMVKEKPYFIGLPITLNGLLFPLIYFLHWNTEAIFVIAFVGMSVAMISRIKVPKI